jgi:hypothetical protein
VRLVVHAGGVFYVRLVVHAGGVFYVGLVVHAGGVFYVRLVVQAESVCTLCVGWYWSAGAIGFLILRLLWLKGCALWWDDTVQLWNDTVQLVNLDPNLLHSDSEGVCTLCVGQHCPAGELGSLPHAFCTLTQRECTLVR